MMRHVRPYRAASLLAAVALVVLLPSIVVAHAELDTPTPADKSTVTQPVTVVSGTFTQRVKTDGSSLVVKRVGGGTVATGGVDPSDDRTMVATPATALGSGSYRVEWTTISLDDGELARGTWTFVVDVAPTPSPTPLPTPTPTAAQPPSPTAGPATPPATSRPTPVPSAGGDTTGSGSDVILPIVLALVVLGGGAAYLLTRRNRPTDAA
jgi:methionine-rich copper-binding protein CopC